SLCIRSWRGVSRIHRTARWSSLPCRCAGQRHSQLADKLHRDECARRGRPSALREICIRVAGNRRSFRQPCIVRSRSGRTSFQRLRKESAMIAVQEGQHTLSCMEVWGGNQSVIRCVELPDLTAWIYSNPAGGSSGGDVHYLSVCGHAILSRV